MYKLGRSPLALYYAVYVKTRCVYAISAYCDRVLKRVFHSSGKRFRLLGTVLTLSLAVVFAITDSNSQGIGTPMASTPNGTPIPNRVGVAIRVTILDENKNPLK